MNWNPSPRTLQQFGLIAAGAAALFAGWLWYQHGMTPYVWSLGVISLGCALCGLLWPESMRYPYLGAMLATFPIGWVMSYVVLAVIYYGVFTATAMIFRWLGRDALQRKFDPAAVTYWQPKAPARSIEQYLRQY